MNNLELSRVGSVKLQRIVGAPVEAELVMLPIRLADTVQYQNVTKNEFLTIHCALCTDMSDDFILTADMVRRLFDLQVHISTDDESVIAQLTSQSTTLDQ